MPLSARKSHPATKAQSGSGRQAAHFAKLAPQQRKDSGRQAAPSARFAPGWQPGSGQQAAHFAQLAPQGWPAAFEQLAPNWQSGPGWSLKQQQSVPLFLARQAKSSLPPDGPLYVPGSQAVLRGADSPRPIPATLQEVTQRLTSLGFPRRFPTGVRIWHQPDGWKQLEVYQTRVPLHEAKLDAQEKADDAKDCLFLTGDKVLLYPKLRAEAFELFEKYLVLYYQQCLLAYSLPGSHPAGRKRGGAFLDFQEHYYNPLDLPTPLTSVRYIEAKIVAVTRQLAGAKLEADTLASTPAVEEFELGRPRRFALQLALELAHLESLLPQLKAGFLKPDLSPFSTLIHPPGWPAVLCEALDEWVVGDKYTPK